MVITFSFLGLKGQTASSPEDDGMGHGHLHMREGRKVAMAITLSFLGLEGQASSSLEDIQ